MNDRVRAIGQVFPDPESLCQAAAERFAQAAAAATARSGRFTVALSGGSTPKRLFELLAAPPWRDGVDWQRLHVFWGDERTVPPDHPDSNYRMAHAALLRKVPIPAAQIHRLQGEAADLDQAARAYQAALASVFGVAPDGLPPALDLVLLGMGGDGHTASLFPYTTALGENERWVVANSVPQLKTERLTLTVPMLNSAQQVLFLVAGAEKAAVLADVLVGPRDVERLPSQLIQPAGGNLHWFVDRAAASRLSPQTLMEA